MSSNPILSVLIAHTNDFHEGCVCVCVRAAERKRVRFYTSCLPTDRPSPMFGHNSCQTVWWFAIWDRLKEIQPWEFYIVHTYIIYVWHVPLLVGLEIGIKRILLVKLLSILKLFIVFLNCTTVCTLCVLCAELFPNLLQLQLRLRLLLLLISFHSHYIFILYTEYWTT